MPANVVARALKIVAGVTAVLSLAFGIRQGVLYVTDMLERKQRVSELLSVAEIQQQSRDYRAAWTSLGQAALLRARDDSVQRARENLAMVWVQNASSSQGISLAGIGDSGAMVLTRGIITARGSRRADLIAHLGWTEFLRWRARERELNPAARYRQALEADSQNPFANAMLGHWLLWNEREHAIADANRHFAAGLASGREVAFVRHMALTAFANVNTAAADLEMLRIANEMRLANEAVDESDRDRIDNVYRRFVRSYDRKPDSLRLAGVVTPADVVLTYRWLYQDTKWARSNALEYSIRLGRLQEAAYDTVAALATYQLARREAERDSRHSLPGIDGAMARLSRH